MITLICDLCANSHANFDSNGLFDRLPESAAIAAMSSQQSRGERVSDGEFNAYRMEVKRLYQEEGASKKQVIDFLQIKLGKSIT